MADWLGSLVLVALSLSHTPALKDTITMSALGLSFAKQLKASRTFGPMAKRLAERYANLAGHRQVGLRYDDVLIEESAAVQKALGRLSEREAYDRAYRLRVASMCAIAHQELPKAEQVKPEEDVRYLKPLVEEVEAEEAERSAFDHATRA
ncbi:Cytochrome b-c1 complex subunit 7, mitochondrial [Rhodotorula toruloides]